MFWIHGIHRFYVRKYITGVLMLITLGGLSIWWLIDIYRIITGRFKDKQGNPLSVAQRRADQPNAGFWVRLAAISVDGLVIGLVLFIVIFPPMTAYWIHAGFVYEPEALMNVVPIETIVQVGLAIELGVLILYMGYFVGLTAGKHQGTYGKRSMGIYVRKRSDGSRVWIGSSLLRFIGYFISWIPLGIGYLMAAFGRKLALHDLIAGTEVVYGTPSEETVSVDREGVTEIMPAAEPTPAPVSIAVEDTIPSRVPEILVGTGLLLILGAGALAYMR